MIHQLENTIICKQIFKDKYINGGTMNGKEKEIKAF